MNYAERISTTEIELVLLEKELKLKEEKYLNSFWYKVKKFIKRMVNKHV